MTHEYWSTPEANSAPVMYPGYGPETELERKAWEINGDRLPDRPAHLCITAPEHQRARSGGSRRRGKNG